MVEVTENVCPGSKAGDFICFILKSVIWVMKFPVVVYTSHFESMSLKTHYGVIMEAEKEEWERNYSILDVHWRNKIWKVGILLVECYLGLR